MVKSAEHGDCGNAPLEPRGTWNGLLVPESLVRACLVEETHVLSNDTSKNWTLQQAGSYARAGIARVFVWETSAARASQGCARPQLVEDGADARVDAPCRDPRELRMISKVIEQQQEACDHRPVVARRAAGMRGVAGPG